MICHRSLWNRLYPIGLSFCLATFHAHLCALELAPAPQVAAATSTASAAQKPSAPKYTLHASASWQLNAPNGERFDASALLFLPDGSLLTLNDRSHIIHRIQFGTAPGTADLIPEPNLFSTNGMYSTEVPPPRNHDVEGLARDSQGRIYMCEESRRRILRFDPATKKGEVLDIDWTPVRKYFDSKDSNASFEGVAVGGDTLYVANERNVGRIIAIDLKTLKILEHFQVLPLDRPARDVHYSDLSWFADQLWVLCRESHCVLRVDPKSHKVLAEYDYSNLELSHATAYLNPYPGYGFMEGLAVDANNIWLAIDNNGFPRIADPKDTRPSVYRCLRPDTQ